MESQGDYGKAEIVPINILPGIAFDFHEGRTLPARLGKTDAPWEVLPTQVFDHQALTFLEVTIEIREDATPPQIRDDLQRLSAALNELDASFSGEGLMPREEVAGTNGVRRLTYRPNRLENASCRLIRMAALINESGSTATFLERPMPSFLRLTARAG